VQAGLVEKSGAWYAYQGNRIGQGKDNARHYLKEHAQIAQEIEQQIRAKLLSPGSVDGTAQDGAEGTGGEFD
jgi:recombination protein RecA